MNMLWKMAVWAMACLMLQTYAMDTQPCWLLDLPPNVQERICYYIFLNDLIERRKAAYTDPVSCRHDNFHIDLDGHVVYKDPQGTALNVSGRGCRYKAFCYSLSSRYVASIEVPITWGQNKISLYSFTSKRIMNFRLPNEMIRKVAIRPAWAEHKDWLKDGIVPTLFKAKDYWRKAYTKIAVSPDGNTIALADHHQVAILKLGAIGPGGYGTSRQIASYAISFKKHLLKGPKFWEQIRTLDFDDTGYFVGWWHQPYVDAPKTVNIEAVGDQETGGLLRHYLYAHAVCKK